MAAANGDVEMLDAVLDGLRFVARLVMFHDEQFNFMGPFREIARRDGASSEFQRCDEEQVLRGGSENVSNVLDVHISNLRRKIGDGYIRTVRGVGYVVDRQPPKRGSRP